MISWISERDAPVVAEIRLVDRGILVVVGVEDLNEDRGRLDVRCCPERPEW